MWVSLLICQTNKISRNLHYLLFASNRCRTLATQMLFVHLKHMPACMLYPCFNLLHTVPTTLIVFAIFRKQKLLLTSLSQQIQIRLGTWNPWFTCVAIFLIYPSWNGNSATLKVLEIFLTNSVAEFPFTTTLKSGFFKTYVCLCVIVSIGTMYEHQVS